MFENTGPGFLAAKATAAPIAANVYSVRPVEHPLCSKDTHQRLGSKAGRRLWD